MKISFQEKYVIILCHPIVVVFINNRNLFNCRKEYVTKRLAVTIVMYWYPFLITFIHFLVEFCLFYARRRSFIYKEICWNVETGCGNLCLWRWSKIILSPLPFFVTFSFCSFSLSQSQSLSSSNYLSPWPIVKLSHLIEVQSHLCNLWLTLTER